ALSESLIKTPPGVCVSSTTPTSLPLLSFSAVWADCAAADHESPAVSSDAIPTISIDFKIVINGLRSIVACNPRPRDRHRGKRSMPEFGSARKPQTQKRQWGGRPSSGGVRTVWLSDYIACVNESLSIEFGDGAPLCFSS